MAVSVDTKFEKGSSNSSSPFSFVSNAGTVAGTIGANSNRLLIGYVCFRAITSSAVSMTWNGVAMTQIGSKLTVASNYDIYLFGLIAPATGANTLSVAWTGGAAEVVLGALSVFSADQTTGWQNSGTDTATSTTAASVVTSANGNLAVIGHVNNDASSTNATTGTTLDWKEESFNGNFAMAHKASSGASTTVSLDLGSSVAWGNQKIDVIAFAASGSGSVTEAASATDSPSAVQLEPASASEAAAAATTQSAVQLEPASASEAASAADSPSATQAEPSSISEAGSGSDAPSATQTEPASLSEPGAGSDSPSSVQTQPASLSEAASAADVVSITTVSSADLSESASADDAVAATVSASARTGGWVSRPLPTVPYDEFLAQLERERAEEANRRAIEVVAVAILALL